MILVAAVTAVIIELFLSGISGLRHYRWFLRYRDWLMGRLSDVSQLQGAGGVLIVLLPVVGLVAVFQIALRDVMLGLPWLLFAIIVLVWCLRYQALDHLIDVFTEASAPAASDESAQENEFTARQAAAGILHREVPAGPQRAAALTEVLLVEAHERLFGVLFWFIVLGPVGAVLFRLAWLLEQHADDERPAFAEASRRLYGILAWLPARTLAVSYALAGSFEDAIHDWQRGEDNDPLSPEASTTVLATTGYGALTADRYAIENADDKTCLEPEAVAAAQGLVMRSLLIWGVTLVLLALAGWAA